jgi:hypothetical protein
MLFIFIMPLCDLKEPVCHAWAISGGKRKADAPLRSA